MLNKTEIKGNWHVLKGKLKEKYAQLTDNDLLYVEGKEEELLGRIQQRTGRTRREIERDIENLLPLKSR
ncbi:CsbD family protein [Vampirovibrio chlorellavorus]|uniref:CsbD family protein n=1 Tax=Vampirovibrio chlorellavorus TaxID=758823 RepID=UPI0026EAB04A|nr:CsbD family protein [Vampirovibrio chlorellavorus]